MQHRAEVLWGSWDYHNTHISCPGHQPMATATEWVGSVLGLPRAVVHPQHFSTGNPQHISTGHPQHFSVGYPQHFSTGHPQHSGVHLALWAERSTAVGGSRDPLSGGFTENHPFRMKLISEFSINPDFNKNNLPWR